MTKPITKLSLSACPQGKGNEIYKKISRRVVVGFSTTETDYFFFCATLIKAINPTNRETTNDMAVNTRIET